MGCDIHAYIVTDKDTSERLDLGRNYDFFCPLADVRNESHGKAFEPIAGNRGFPNLSKFDYVREIYEDKWGSDGHSASWATKEEIIKAIKASMEPGEKLEENYWYRVIVKEMELFGEDAVLAFFFDN